MEEVVNGIYRQKIGMSHCFILDKPDGLYLMDAGYDGSGKKIIQFVKEAMRVTDKQLKSVLVSHHHVDHASGLWKLEETFNVPIFAHPLDVPVILREQQPPRGEGLLGYVFSWVLKLSRYHPPRRVSTTESWTFPFTVMHLPGHTDGHVAVYDPDTNSILCADLLTVGKKSLKLPPRFFNQSTKNLLKSIRQLKQLIERKELSVKNLIPSHGQQYMKDAESFILERLTGLLDRYGS